MCDMTQFVVSSQVHDTSAHNLAKNIYGERYFDIWYLRNFSHRRQQNIRKVVVIS